MDVEERTPVPRASVAAQRASKANQALGEDSPGFDPLFTSIMDGTEEHQRKQALLQHHMKMRGERVKLAQEFISTKEPGTFSNQDLDFVMGLTDATAQEAGDNPKTFFESEYAKWMVNTHQGSNLEGAAAENEPVAAGILDAAEYTIFQKEVAQKWTEDLEARWEEKGMGGKAWAYTEGFIPFYTWTNLSGAMEQAPLGSVLPGNNLGEQYQYAMLLPKEEYVAQVGAAIDQIAEHNLLDAMHFAQGLAGYSTSDQFLDNVLIGGGDLATFIPGAAGISRMRMLAGSTKDLIKAAGTRSVSPITLKTVAGDAPGAAHDLAVKKIREKANSTEALGRTFGGEDTFDDLAGELDSIFNPPAALGLDKDAGTFLREHSQRLVSTMTHNGAEMLRTVVDPLNPGRLSDEALHAGIQNAEEVLKQQYPELNDVIMRSVPLNKADTLLDTERVAFHIGKKGAVPFKTQGAATNAAERYYKLRDNYVVRQYGDGQFYIEVQKSIDETSTSVRDVPVINTRHETPKTLLNAFIGVLRTPDDLMSPALMESFKATAYGASGYIKRLRELAKPIGKLKNEKDFVSFLETQRDFVNPYNGERGRFSKTLGEFERDWHKHTSRTPTVQEAEAYFTFKQFNDYNYMMYNLDLLRDKSRAGLERFVIPWLDTRPIKPSQRMPLTAGLLQRNSEGRPANTLPLEGKYLSEGIDWSLKENEGIWIFDHKGPNKDGYVNKRFTNKEKFEKELGGENYHVIRLSPEGKRNLAAEKSLQDVMPDGPVDYIVVKDYETRPLNWKQIPYRAGGRVEFPEGYFVRQPRVKRIEQGGEEIEHLYDGDHNVLNFQTEADAKFFTPRIEKARQMLKEALGNGGPRAYAGELSKYLDENLPWDFEDFYKLFTVSRDPNAKLDLDTPFYYTAKGKSVNDTHKLGETYKNLRDTRQSASNLYNTVNLKYAMERDNPMHTISQAGDPDNPIYNLKTATHMDPLTTINRSMSQLMAGRYLENMKFKLSEQFINEFGRFLKTSPEELRRNPMKHLMDPDWLEANKISDRAGWAAAKNFRRTSINFMGLRTDFQENVRFVKQKLADYIYDKAGDKAFKIVEPYLLGQTKDPVTLLRSVAFHTHLGLFNPIQLFIQAQTTAHIIGVEGPTRAYQAMGAYSLQRALMFNDSPEMLNAVAKKAKAFGWKEDEFKESYQGLRESGMWNIGGEHAMRDDMMDPNIIQGTWSRVLESGTFFFSEGERMNRMGAWNAAYKRWRTANPGKKFDNDAKLEVLSRADLLSVNMTNASNAAWGRGFASIPTQFMNYQVRLAEQFLGKRLTGVEKARALLTYSMLYGAPVAAGVPVAMWPVHEEIRKAMLERGIEYDENIISKTLVDGMASMAVEYATGTKMNVGSRYGPGGLSFLKDIVNGEKGVIETLMGASGMAAGNIISNEPFTNSIVALLRMDQDAFPIVARDWEEFASTISSVNNVRKMYYAIHIGQYASKTENLTDEVTGLEGVLMGILGTTPQRIEDTFLKLESNKELAAMQKEERKQAIKWYRLSFRTKNEAEMASYMRRAKMHLVAGGFNDGQIVSIFRDAVKGNESLVMGIGQDFADKSPERLKAWQNEITKRSEE